MKKQTFLAWSSLLYSVMSFATDPACPTTRGPCGVEEVISCARATYNTTAKTPIQTNLAFYNSQLFDVGNQDGFCEYKSTAGGGTKYPPGVQAGSLQQIYYDQFCSHQTGTYFSYANFIAAANAVFTTGTNQGKLAFGGAAYPPSFPTNGSDTSGGFACSQTGNIAQDTLVSTQEVVNFFASEAQETTSALINYTTDGLYFRYENGALLDKSSSTGAVCTDQYCKTGYYPGSDPGNWVGVATYGGAGAPQNTTTYTPYLWLLTNPNGSAPSLYYPQYQMATSPMSLAYGFPSIPLLATSPDNPSISNSQLYKISSQVQPPGGPLTTAYNINDSGILYPGMYVGMGSLQLTGSSMYFYYGWYENNIATGAPILLGNFDTFVGDPTGYEPNLGFLRDGVVAFEGAFWYWMYRVIGINTTTYPGQLIPSLHQLALDPARPACHCVGAVTLMINGGCNHFDRRVAYANYFASKDALNLNSSQINCKQTVTLPGAQTSVAINGANCVLVCPAGYTLSDIVCKKAGYPDVNPTLDAATQNLLTYCQTPISEAYP